MIEISILLYPVKQDGICKVLRIAPFTNWFEGWVVRIMVEMGVLGSKGLISNLIICAH